MLFELKNYIDDIGLRVDVHAVKLSDIRDKEEAERDKSIPFAFDASTHRIVGVCKTTKA